MQNITSYLGEAHVTSDQFRSIIESIAGVGSYIADLDEQLEPELSTNNTLKIRSGVLIHHGHVMRVPTGTYDTVTYINGSQGMKRIDLVVARYEKNSETKKEPTRWVVIQGTPAASNPVAPVYNDGNMQNGDLLDDCPVFEMHFDGINVTEVKKLVEVTKNIDDLRKDVDKLNSTFVNSVINDDSSGWSYRKWSTGEVEMWFRGYISFPSSTINSGITNVYVTSAQKTMPVTIKSGTGSIFASIAWNYTEWVTAQISDGNTIKIRKFCNLNSINASGDYINLYVKGIVA